MKNLSPHSPLQRVVAELEGYFDFLGIEGLPASWFTDGKPVSAAALASQDSEVTTISPKASVSVSAVGKSPEFEEYEHLRLQANTCTRCRLHETRKSVVFGIGATNAPPIAFVGEGPGAEEDRLGEPFVGKAGALLTAAINKGLKLEREQVYICNVVKCRPPENRNPLPDEVASCRGYLEAQLRIVRPQVLVTLGAPALQTLTGLEGGITRLRGIWREWEGIPLLPTFHPAYILRNPSAKREFWEDLQKVMQRLGW